MAKSDVLFWFVSLSAIRLCRRVKASVLASALASWHVKRMGLHSPVSQVMTWMMKPRQVGSDVDETSVRPEETASLISIGGAPRTSIDGYDVAIF